MTLSSHELWRPSALSLDQDDDHYSLFPAFDPGTEPDHLPLAELHASVDGNAFAWPVLTDDHVKAPIADSDADHWLTPSAPPLSDASNPAVTDDIWTLGCDLLGIAPANHLATWESFHSNAPQNELPFCLSEAGPGVFDALVQQRENTEGMLPRDVVLRACCSLVLGRGSVFFTWSENEQRFTRTLENVTIGGLSVASCSSVLQEFMDIGGKWRKLSRTVQMSKTRDCVAMVALRTCVADVLEGLEAELVRRFEYVITLLQLQDAVARPSNVLAVFEALVEGTSQWSTDATVISGTADLVINLAERGDQLCRLMREVLTRVSAPWLEELAGELGLNGQTERAAEPHDVDELGSSSDLLSFLPIEDQRLVRSTRDGIRALRQQRKSPENEIATPSGAHKQLAEVTPEPSRNTWILDVQSRQLAERSHDMFALPHDALFADTFEMTVMDDTKPDQQRLSSESLNTHIASARGMYDAVRCSDHNLQEALLRFLADDGDATLLGDTSICVSTDIDLLHVLRPRLEKQASLARRAASTHIFTTHNLSAHLALHRGFHLFGNGDFTTRLTTALFSDEVQTAERRRGVVPTGQIMGLQLGSRECQRWPPASSELRLTLMGVLTDSHFQADAAGQLPGGLSFAIRELSDEEIDLVMDTTSIHALDFLKLQYNPPEALTSIFSPTVMQHYDSIFRTTLVHVRLMHTTAQLARMATKSPLPSRDESGTVHSFAWRARHFVVTITSHFMHVVIAAGWDRFMAAVNGLAPNATASSQSGQTNQCASVDDIAQLHLTCLEQIRNGMFLRKRHEMTRQSIEEVLQIVLRGALQILHGVQSDMVELETDFERARETLMSLLTEEVQRPLKGSAALAEQEREKEAVSLLLAALDWQGVHSR